MSATSPLSGLERGVVVLDVVLGLAVCVLAGLSLAGGLAGAADPHDPHGGAWGFLGAVLLGPPGLLFFLAAVGVARRWRGRWWLHALPPLAPVLFMALGDAGLLR